MDSNSGLPAEILVLCTTTETKEKAVKLLDWIRNIHGELACEPAMPAICSLIASEQLGNTVVTERRAQQWSRSTPEHFRAIIAKVQKLLIASRMHHRPPKARFTLQTLVAEFCPDPDALSHVTMVEKAFRETNGKERWHLESDLVQLSLFIWSCRQFKIRTFKSIEEIRRYHDPPAASFSDIQNFLDEHFTSTFFKSNTGPSHIPILAASQESSRPSTVPSPSPSIDAATPVEGTYSSGSSIRLEDLAREFGVADNLVGGMRYLDKMVRESEDFKDLVNWSSTMGRCVVFYWTCSVLKIPGAKHITLRNRFQLLKREFDKILSALDLQRGELRRKLDEFYAGNPAFQSLPQPASFAKSQHVPPGSDLVSQPSTLPIRMMSGISSKRGRPPRPKTPPPMSLDPVSKQEKDLSSLCAGPVFKRALLLLRSFNARRHLAAEADHVPPESLHAIVVLVASRQLGDSQIGERQAIEASRLVEGHFATALATVRASIDVFETRRLFAPYTTFDALALEHGLGIDTVVSMLHVREALKDSRCLSIGMDWESPLVKCSVFFWTCAILKIPDVKQTILRSRSLVSKREFDSMLQLLNSHCAVVRQQLENNSASAVIFAPPPYISLRPRDDNGDVHNGRPKRAKRDTQTPSDVGSEVLDDQPCYEYVPSKKPGRPPGYRKIQQRGDVSDESVIFPFDTGPKYIPRTQFPPADWKPPESLSNAVHKASVSSSACPPSETGDSKRRHTRYSTADYQDSFLDRIAIWKPDGDEIREQQIQYRRWEEKMSKHYGPQWEKNISHETPGIPFE